MHQGQLASVVASTLAEQLRDEGVRVLLILGCRTASQVPVLPSLDAIGPVITTDDGSNQELMDDLENLYNAQITSASTSASTSAATNAANATAALTAATAFERDFK